MAKMFYIFLVMLLIFQPVLIRAEEISRSLPSVAVYSRGGDDFLKKVSRDLVDSISATSCCHVVDANIVDDIAKYHEDRLKKGTSSDEGIKLLSQAKEQYFGFKYKEAREKVERAISVFKSRGYQSSGKELMDSLLLRALLAKALHEDGVIQGLSSEMVKINPMIDLETGKLPPTLAAEIENSRQVLMSQGVGELKVRSKPPVTEVYLNGISRGLAPMEINKLPAGQYLITLKATNYTDYSQFVTVETGKEVVIKGKLDWIDASKNKDEASSIAEGARLAGLLKVDKMVVLTSDTRNGVVRALMVDRKYSVAHKPYEMKMINTDGISISGDEYSNNLAWLADKLSFQVSEPIASRSVTKVVGLSEETPSEFFSGMKKPIYKRPLFWTGVGATVAGGILAGLLISFGSGSANSGDLRVRFGADSR